jgi:hypothetical protein
MAVTAVAAVGGIRWFLAASRDQKPTDSSIGPGSRFLETDTGLEYLYDGSAWRPWNPLGAASALAMPPIDLSRTNDLLEQIRDLMEIDHASRSVNLT